MSKAETKSESDEADALVFIPCTLNGELAKRLREKVDEMAPGLGWKFKVVEKAGVSIKAK